MKIKDMKKWIEQMNDENDIFVALETKDENGIDVWYCYEVESACENGESLQINIKE